MVELRFVKVLCDNHDRGPILEGVVVTEMITIGVHDDSGFILEFLAPSLTYMEPGKNTPPKNKSSKMLRRSYLIQE